MNCPFCNNEIPDTAKFCSKCGGKIPQQNTVDLNFTNQMPPKIHYCKDCGVEMTGPEEYCENCRTRGMNYSMPPKDNGMVSPPPIPYLPKKKKSILPTILLIILCILLSLSAIFLGYSYVTKSFFFAESTEKKDKNDSKEDSETPGIDIANDDNEEDKDDTQDPGVKIDDPVPEEEYNAALVTAQQYRKDAEPFRGHAYAIFNYQEEGLTSFNGCERFCEAMGGHLAVIDDAEENEFLYSYVQSCGLKLAFFGYTDQKTEDHWEWVNGSTSTYTNWCRIPGKEQPNDGKNNKSAGGEDYAEFYKDTADGTWNDTIFGKNTYRFICEWE